MRDTVLRRRAFGLLTIGVVLTALSFGFGHRGVHAVRSLIVPGAGLYDQRHWLLGIGFTVCAVAATVAWLRWGMDWSVLAVTVAAMAWSAALAYADHPAATLHASPAAHEFPLVVIVMGGVSWLRLAWRRTSIGRARAQRSTPTVPLLDRCRAAALLALADPVARPELDADPLRRRARRVGVAARGRWGGDPLRIDHAHTRAALALCGQLDEAAVQRLRADSEAALFGVPNSEPGWVRLLDGTLAACALRRLGAVEAGERWADALQGSFALRRGHRPSSVWTPLGLRGPRVATWEHVAATGLCRLEGWIATDDDWHTVRTRALAAAARGSSVPDDERLVAASRLWLRVVPDEQAERIIGRVTVQRDAIAVALDQLARSWQPADTSDPAPTPDPSLESTRRIR